SYNDVAFNSSRSTGATPDLRITYEYGLGEPDYAPIISQGLTDRQTIDVNPVSGNLLLNSNDLHVTGTGLDLSLQRVYNGLASCRGPRGGDAFGPAWLMNTGLDRYLQVFSDGAGVNGVAYHDGTGWAVPFVKSQTDGSLNPPPGTNLKLTQNADGTY